MERHDNSLKTLLENTKYIDIHIIAVPEGEKRKKKKRPEKISEGIIAENVPNKGKETVIQVQKAQRIPGRIYPRKNLQKHRVVKSTKIKENEKELKETRENQQIIYKGTHIKLSADFSAEPLQARRRWMVYLK